jgi:hypothetical protein
MLTTLHMCKGEVVISSWFSLLFYVWSSFLQWTCSFQIISCFPSTSLSSEVDFLTTKFNSRSRVLDDEVDSRSWILDDEVDRRSWILDDEVDKWSWILDNEVDKRSRILDDEVEFLTTKSVGEVEFLTTKLKYIILYTFPCKWISLGYFYIFHTTKFGHEFFWTKLIPPTGPPTELVSGNTRKASTLPEFNPTRVA